MAIYTTDNFVPTPAGPYPGQGSPSPLIGVPNRITTPVGAATAQPNYAPPVVDPAIGQAQYLEAPVTTIEVEVRNQVNNPVPPPIAVGNFAPIIGSTPDGVTPLGTSPHFETPTERWTWDYGNGGTGGNDGGP